MVIGQIPHNWLSIAPCFFAITNSNIGPVSLQITPVTFNMT